MSTLAKRVTAPQCSAMHSGVNPLHPRQRNFVDPTSKRPRTCVAAQRSQTSVLTLPKWSEELWGTIATWRTRCWARLEVAEALEDRLGMLGASNLEFYWILHIDCSLFIMCSSWLLIGELLAWDFTYGHLEYSPRVRDSKKRASCGSALVMNSAAKK